MVKATILLIDITTRIRLLYGTINTALGAPVAASLRHLVLKVTTTLLKMMM